MREPLLRVGCNRSVWHARSDGSAAASRPDGEEAGARAGTAATDHAEARRDHQRRRHASGRADRGARAAPLRADERGNDRASRRDDSRERHPALACLDAVGRRRVGAWPVVEQLSIVARLHPRADDLLGRARRAPHDGDDRRQAEAAAHRHSRHRRSLRATELPVRGRREARGGVLRRDRSPI